MNDNVFTVFTEGDALYADMLDAIAGAGKQIALESYIFEDDAIGQRFAEALIERAAAGIRVRLHLDAFGSLSLAVSDIPGRMTEAGIELKWFNPWHWYAPFSYNRRNHRKLLVVDGETAWLGGFNIHRENSLALYGQERWRDTQVRMDGPLAGQAQVYFDRLWDGLRRWPPAVDIFAHSVLVSNHNWFQRHQLRRLLAIQFYRSRSRIWLCTPYFMPDRFLQRQMIKAARRGREVRLLLPQKTDRPVAQWVAKAAYSSLMASGIRIFEYQPRVLHGKVMVIDDNWCSVGTANLDYRSLYVNFEINLVSTREDLAATLAEDYRQDLVEAREIDPQEWHRHNWQRRMYEMLGWLCRRFL